MSGALGITNPFATNYPDLMKIDESIARQQYNRLLGEDLRSQIAERQAAIAYRQATPDYGPRTGTEGATTGGGGGTAPSGASLTPFLAKNLPEGISSEEDQIVRTVYGEAGGESPVGQRAVAAVIRNRAAASGRSAQDVIFAPSQFEPWNNPTTRAKLESLDPSSPEYQRILTNIRSDTADPTGGATHFYSPSAQAALGRQPPSWGNAEPSAVIGGHNFYRIGYAPGGGAPGAFPAAQQQATAAPPAASGGQPPAGPGVVAGPGGAPSGGPPAGAAVAVGAAARRLLAMPEPEAAAAYPGVVQEMKAAGIELPNAPATYPGHAAVQQLVDRLGAGTAQPPAAQPAAQPAAAAVPPPTPPPRTNEQGLTNNDQDRLGEYRRSPTSTVAGEAAMRSQMVQRNEAAKEAYRTNLEQYTERQYQHGQDAQRAKVAEDAAKRAGLPTGYRLGADGKAERIPGLPPEKDSEIPSGYRRVAGDPSRLEAIPGGPAALAAEAEGSKVAQQNASIIQKRFEQENALRDEFQKLTADFRVVQTSYENIRKASQSKDGAGDMSLLYSYVRLLDPTSVVRESEFGTAAASGSLGQRVQGAYERLVSGGRMPDDLREAFVRESRALYNTQRKSHDTVADQYEKLAKDNDLHPERVVTRFDRPQEDTTPPTRTVRYDKSGQRIVE